jgi:TRAP-type mannitol/chloroaromatic compound transport system substrate-binding protein
VGLSERGGPTAATPEERVRRTNCARERAVSDTLDRRRFLKAGAIGAAAVGIAACTGSAVDDEADSEADGEATTGDEEADGLAEEAAGDSSLPEIEFEMATSWPLSLDTIYGGAVVFAETLSALSGGRFNITPRAGGELVGGLEVLPAVRDGAVQGGHTASYYYVGETPSVAFGTAVPFGLTYRQQNAWLYEGGGLEIMQQLYADRFNMIQFPAGNTGVQMGGWWNTEVNSVADIQGLTVRIPGLGGEVMTRLGATVQAIPGGEIFQALDTGAIDAAEWVGPYDDLQLGLNDAAEFYYYPGFWEPGPTLEVQFNLDDFNSWPSIYQDMIRAAARVADTTMMARYDNLNPGALDEIASSGTQVVPYSDEILEAARTAAFEYYDETAAGDQEFADIYNAWNAYRIPIQQWFGQAEVRMAEFTSAASADEG